VMLDIVGIGLACLDHLYLLEDIGALPWGRVLDCAVQGGGPAATAMAAASVLGARCGMVAAVGDDERGQQILAGLRECGVDTSAAAIKKNRASPLVLVLVDSQSGERYFCGLKGPAARVGPHDVNWDYVARARILHTDAFVEGTGGIVRRARQMGLTVSVDGSVEAALEADWVQYVDVFIAGADAPEWRAKPQEALGTACAIAARGPGTVILTLGEAGCVGLSEAGSFVLEGFTVDVVDTTGTGDVFHGAYVFGLGHGWETREAAMFASATAALSARRLGGRAGLPRLKEVQKYLSAHGQTGPWAGL